LLTENKDKLKVFHTTYRVFKETATFTQNKPLIIDITPLPAATSFVNGVYYLTEKKKNRKEIKLDGENTEQRESI